MRLRRIAFSALIACGLLAGGAVAADAQSFAAGVHIGPSGRASVDLNYFQSGLSSYGRWVHQSVYGDVFVPRVRYSNWRPYQYGHWVYTDYGWTWVSSEPFGWATYHYGRWAYDSDYGWIWVPGTEWGPAWVAWQSGDNYVGWAALPPTVGFEAGVGVDLGGFDVGVDLAPVDYVFVPQNRFLVANVGSYCLAPQQNVAIFGRTRNITNYAFVGGRIVNRGWPVETAQRVIGRVPRYQVADARSFTSRASIQGNRLQVFRPVVNAPRNARTAERIAAENRGANAPARLAERRAAQARMAAIAGRNSTRQAAANATARQQQARLANARARQQGRAQAERQQIAARSTRERQNERVQARNERQQTAARAAEQRTNQRNRAQAQRQQIAARSQAQRSRERAQAQSARNQQRAQAARSQQRNEQRSQAQASRNQQREQAQAARSQQRAQAQASRNQQQAQAQATRNQQRAQAARNQQRAERQQPARQQPARQQRQQPQRNRPPQDGGQDQRRPHGA